MGPSRAESALAIPGPLKYMAKGRYGQCVYCHDLTTLTDGHRYHKRDRLAHPDWPGINDKEDLCWGCHHGLLHHSIISWEEVAKAGAATRAGTRRVTHDQVMRQLNADIAAGRRQIKPNFDNRSAKERSDGAKQAWITIKRRQIAGRQPLF
jgi:hypothetical protein